MKSDKYYIHRKLSGVVEIGAHAKTISVPEGVEISEKHQKLIDVLVNEFGYIVQKVIDVKPYEYITVMNSIGIRGLKINFIEATFFGLRPGNKILQIGSGKKTADNAVDKFTEPAKYCGMLYYGTMKLYAFQLPTILAPDADYSYFLLYRKVKGKILRMGVNPKYDKTFLAKFKMN